LHRQRGNCRFLLLYHEPQLEAGACQIGDTALTTLQVRPQGALAVPIGFLSDLELTDLLA
jgi:hypothetical protein